MLHFKPLIAVEENEESAARSSAFDRTCSPVPTEAADEADRERRRTEKRLREALEPIEPWDRYRALRHALDEAQKLEDLADHKARFALILMGALNALLLVLEFRIDLLGLLSASARLWIVGYLVFYGLAAFYFFLQAIEALRPRTVPRALAHDGAVENTPAELRHHDGILERDLHAYLRAWKEVRVGQLNTEIALQLHRQAQVSRAKHRALHRLYWGLRVMTFLMAGLVLIGTLSSRSGARLGSSDASSAAQTGGASSPVHGPAVRALGPLPWSP